MIPDYNTHLFCKDCKYWDERKECRAEHSTGMCRVNAPLVKYVNGSFKSAWPITGSHDWCGQFEAK